MTDATEKDDLEAGLASGFWRRLTAHVEAEWEGAAYHDQVAKAVGNPDDKLALDHLRQVTVAQREIRRLLAWPKERLAALERQEQARVPSGSRRGGL